MRDQRGPDLALERDHEGRPDERGNTRPAPTRHRRPRGLEDPAPLDAPAETEDDVPEQPVPPSFMAIPASQPLISPARTDAPNISKCMTRSPWPGAPASPPAISLDLLLILLYKLYMK